MFQLAVLSVLNKVPRRALTQPERMHSLLDSSEKQVHATVQGTLRGLFNSVLSFNLQIDYMFLKFCHDD